MKSQLIYDWNLHEALPQIARSIEVCDESLRDGIQSPSVHDPDIEKKYELINLMDQLGITIANIGLPGSGPRAYQDVLDIAKYVRDQRLKIKINCAARTLKQDIEPIARIQEEVGLPISAYCFLGTSPIRQMVENWSLEQLKKHTEDAINFAHSQNLALAFVTEDTTRSNPETLDILFRHAINLGAERLVLCDTVGHATPEGVKALVAFTKNIINDSGTDIKIDWHGHNDRGLGLSNALAAAEYGCHRIHGTALGIGERVGNTAIDQLIVNLKLAGLYPHDVSALVSYVELAANACRVAIPYNYPVAGSDAFRTATGVHAAAVIKAKNTGDNLLADTIYSGVPAHWFGKFQSIDIGPMSGASNVKYWLKEQQIVASEELTMSLLAFAKTKTHVLSDEQVLDFIRSKS